MKAANEQISDLKERLMTIRESHDDIKEDFDKVSKEVQLIALASLSTVGLHIAQADVDSEAGAPGASPVM